nr:reverse transcriptase domain-containing protein [Tanacetum cinerariifolium]
MPFGLCNDPGTFQRCMMAIFHDMIEKTIEVFMDDFSIFGNSFQSCLSHLDQMLKRCEDTNICLNWEKSHFMVKEGIVLGHKISKQGIEEETPPKAMIAIDGVGFDWSYIAEDEVPTNMALMAFLDSEVYNDKTCSKTCLKSYETLKKQYDDLRIEFNKSEFNFATYKRGLTSVEEQLVFYKNNEVLFSKKIDVLKRDISYKGSEISVMKRELEKLKQEKESNQLKIENFDNAFKSLDKLIESQIPDNSKKGLGFESYHAVSPPPTGLFLPPKLDLSKSGLEEFQQPEFEGYGTKTSKNVSEGIPMVEKKTVVPTVAKVEFVRAKQQEKPIKYAEMYMSQVPASAASTVTTYTTSDGTGKKKGRTVIVTTEDMQKRKNDVKARTTLLLSLPDEHQLQFSKYKTAQELWAAILKTFGGNEATKKTKKNLLNQQYGNFKAEDSETLEQTFNRLQVIISQLQFMGIEIEQDDLNQKFLTSLAPEWLMHTIKKSEPNPQNTAFISSAKHSRVNEDVNTASVSTASTNVPTTSANIGVASINQDTTCAYIASQSSGSQIKFEDKKTGKKISIQGTDMAEFDKSKVECFNCHKMGHFVRECKAPRSQDRGRRDNYRQGSKVKEQALKALMAIDGVGWDWSYMANDEEIMHCKITDLTDKLFDAKNMIYHYKLGLAQVESRLVEHKDREIKYCKRIRGLELEVEFKTNSLECLAKELETLKKEKEGLDGKLAGFQIASKHLDSLLESQRLDKKKEGLGYSDDTVTDYSRPAPTVESSPDDAQNRNPSVTETEASPSTNSPKSFIKFVKANDSLTSSKTDKAETAKKPPIKYAEQYLKPTKKPNVRGNKRNWNNLKSHQLGPNFMMKKSACFNYGDFNHLAYDCSKRVKKGTSRSQNNTHKSFTPRPTIHKPYRPPIRPMRSNMN